MVDWNNPTETTAYTDVLDQLRDKDSHLAKLEYGSDTNLPVGAVRRNSSDSDKLEKWNGSAWSTLPFITTIFNHIADDSVHNQLEAGDCKIAFYSTPSSGWLLCNGAEVSRTTYATLFAKIGTTFGAGDGSTTFNLPNLQLRLPIGVGGAVSLGTQTGTWDHTHSTSDHVHSVPQHTHDMANHTHTGGAHTHTIPTHTHNVPGHHHYVRSNGGDISIGWSGGHSHNIPTHESITGGTTRRYHRPTSGASDPASSTATSEHEHPNSSFTGRVGLVPGTNGDASFATDTGTSGGSTGSGGAVATGVPSTNITGLNAAANTGSAGAGSTGAANPPVLGVYFFIKT